MTRTHRHQNAGRADGVEISTLTHNRAMVVVHIDPYFLRRVKSSGNLI